MSRGQGRVYRPKVRQKDGTYRETAVWWIDYSVKGQRFQASSKTTVKGDALKILRDTQAARETGKLVGRPDRVTFDDLRGCLERHYRRENLESWDRAEDSLNRVAEFLGTTFFGKPERGGEATAQDITRGLMTRYVDHRLAHGAAKGTVRAEISALSKAFSAAIDEELLAVRPMFKKPRAANPREGFFSEGDIAALLLELKEPLLSVVRFAYLTGWRRDEVMGLTWDEVDWEDQALRLGRSRNKGKHLRFFPFSAAPDLKSLLEAQYTKRIVTCPLVFHRDGERMHTCDKAWKSACKRAGLPGKLFHDLRRTAVRNFLIAGLDRDEARKLTGHKTERIFTEYNIVDEARLIRAATKGALNAHDHGRLGGDQDAHEAHQQEARGH